MKRRNHSRLYGFLSSPVTLVAALLLLALLGKAAWNIREKAIETDDRLEAARAGYDDLAVSRDDLAARLSRLSTPEGIRAEVRDKYHAVEPGESVAVIIDKDIASTAPASSAEAKERGLWGKLLRVLGL